MKINFILLLKILILEIAYYYLMLFILIFSLFLYFGSGAGASSPTANICGVIAGYILVVPTILFNLYIMIKLYKKSFTDFMSFLIAEIIMVIFFAYQIYTEGILS